MADQTTQERTLVSPADMLALYRRLTTVALARMLDVADHAGYVPFVIRLLHAHGYQFRWYVPSDGSDPRGGLHVSLSLDDQPVDGLLTPIEARELAERWHDRIRTYVEALMSRDGQAPARGFTVLEFVGMPPD